MIKCSIRIDTSYYEPFTGHNCAGGRAFISISFVTLEDPSREPIHQSFIGEKGKISAYVVYFKRIPDKMTGLNSTDLPGALNEDSGIFGSLCPVRVSRRSSRDWIAEFGSSVLYVLYQRQIILKRTVKCHVILKVRASQLVEVKWVKNQTINRAANKEKEVRAKTRKKHKHFH